MSVKDHDGKALAEVRQAAGFGQLALARQMGYTRQAIWGIERSERVRPATWAWYIEGLERCVADRAARQAELGAELVAAGLQMMGDDRR